MAFLLLLLLGVVQRTGTHSPWGLGSFSSRCFSSSSLPVRPSRNRDHDFPPSRSVRPSFPPPTGESFSLRPFVSPTLVSNLPILGTSQPAHLPGNWTGALFSLMRATLAIPTRRVPANPPPPPPPHPHLHPVSSLRACVARQPPSRSPPWVVPSFAPSSTTCRPAACIHHTHHLVPSPRRQVRPCLPQHRSRACAAYTYGNRPQPAPLSPGATRPKSSCPGCPLSPTLFATTTNIRLLQFST